MTYLLDINVISDLIKGLPAVVKKFREIGPDGLFISCVSIYEIEYGFEKNPASRARNHQNWTTILNSMHILAFDQDDAKEAGRIRNILRSRQIGAYDLQLAGVAVAKGLSLVTNNLTEFQQVPGLNLEDWR